MTVYETTLEFNFDGLVGPTHNYAGLAPGNLASQAHKAEVSNPRAAAQQSLAKIKRLHDLGVPQGVLPPQPRPNVDLLRRLGFTGDDARVLRHAQRDTPHLLAAASSGSCMWTANAATVCPSPDAADGRVHLTPANLAAALHRASEAAATAKILKAVFHDPQRFVHHEPLPPASGFSDEGAANHTRFCHDFDDHGIQFFVYGNHDRSAGEFGPRRFTARQSRQACEAVARLHQLDPKRTVFARQHPDAIDAGVFHNDVIAVGHRDLLFCHQSAFADQQATLDALTKASSGRLKIVEVTSNQVTLDDAVSTYLFNSQIVTSGDGRTFIIAPTQCQDNPDTSALLQTLVDDGTFDGVQYVDVHQSMNNGGGPACLRLRVVLTPEEQRAVAPGIVFNDALHRALSGWIDRHYRDRLTPNDLADPDLLRENREALDELTSLLGIGSVFDFQT